MLVLTREVDESIMIGDNVEVIVLSIRLGRNGVKVRLGINAPPEVPVHRLEVFNAINKKGTGKGGDGSSGNPG
jgi:carbon storage regulator